MNLSQVFENNQDQGLKHNGVRGKGFDTVGLAGFAVPVAVDEGNVWSWFAILDVKTLPGVTQ